jgi:hypothetical protein
MLIRKDDGTFIAGSLDVLLILHNTVTNTYHAAVFLEAPMPGPRQPVESMSLVRLRSQMHHTTGAPDLEGARKHLEELSKKISVPDGNKWTDPVEWNGELGITMIVPNWHAAAAAV